MSPKSASRGQDSSNGLEHLNKEAIVRTKETHHLLFCKSQGSKESSTGISGGIVVIVISCVLGLIVALGIVIAFAKNIILWFILPSSLVQFCGTITTLRRWLDTTLETTFPCISPTMNNLSHFDIVKV
jgi:hypothetical protein